MTTCLLLGGTARAETAPAPDQTAQAGPRTNDEGLPSERSDDDTTQDPRDIVVTGTNISGVKAVGSEAVTLDRSAIVATGVSSVADAVRTLPQVRNLGDFREGGTVGSGSGNTQQGNAINLRGLGAQATLTLVDGHRVVATGAGFNFTEANQVPIAALARIEVIADGASAIYGSDAVAGVVNFVLRRDFDGIEASYRVSNQNGGFEMSPSLTFGKTWDSLGGLGRGNIIVAYEYTHRDPYLSGRNRFLRQDLTPFGGPDRRLDSTTVTSAGPANIYVPSAAANTVLPRAGNNTYYGLPQGANVGLTPANLLLNQPNLADMAYYTDYTGRLQRHQVSVFANQELGSWLEAFVQGTYTHRNTFSRAPDQTMQNVTLSPVLFDVAGNPTATPNPYYISGIPEVAPGTPLNVQYSALKDLGGSNFDNTVETYSITGGLKARLPGDWKAEAYYTYGRDTACNSCQLGGQNVNATALQDQINRGLINPLSSLPLSAAQLATFTGDNIQESGNGIDDLVVKFDGPLFALPGGTVRAAVGGERNKQFNFNRNGANRGNDNLFVFDTTEATSRIDRTVWSAFGELYVPIIGEDMNVPFVRSLIIDGAVRYDDYSDFGSTTNPKVGLTWQVNDALSLRGSWGTSFRAPALTDTNLFAFSAVFGTPFPNSDPRITNGAVNLPQFGLTLANAAFIFGSNPNLRPETATNWSVGGNLKLGDFTFDASYYNIRYSNRILPPDVIGAFARGGAPDYGGYGAYVIPINNPATCSNANPATYDPLLGAFLGRTLLFGSLPNPCGVNVVLDQRSTNLAATKQDGIDATLTYIHDFGDVTVNGSGAVSWTLHNKEQVVTGGPFVDRLGFYSTPIEWRGRGSVGALWHGFSANLFLNYTGSYTNDIAVNQLGGSIAPQHVNAWTTFDLTLGYSGDLADVPGSPFKALRVSATVFNLFDRDPPIVVTSRSAINTAYSNPFGRTATMQVTLNF